MRVTSAMVERRLAELAGHRPGHCPLCKAAAQVTVQRVYWIAANWQAQVAVTRRRAAALAGGVDHQHCVGSRGRLSCFVYGRRVAAGGGLWNGAKCPQDREEMGKDDHLQAVGVPGRGRVREGD